MNGKYYWWILFLLVLNTIVTPVFSQSGDMVTLDEGLREKILDVKHFEKVFLEGNFNAIVHLGDSLKVSFHYPKTISEDQIKKTYRFTKIQNRIYFKLKDNARATKYFDSELIPILEIHAPSLAILELHELQNVEIKNNFDSQAGAFKLVVQGTGTDVAVAPLSVKTLALHIIGNHKLQFTSLITSKLSVMIAGNNAVDIGKIKADNVLVNSNGTNTLKLGSIESNVVAIDLRSHNSIIIDTLDAQSVEVTAKGTNKVVANKLTSERSAWDIVGDNTIKLSNIDNKFDTLLTLKKGARMLIPLLSTENIRVNNDNAFIDIEKLSAARSILLFAKGGSISFSSGSVKEAVITLRGNANFSARGFAIEGAEILQKNNSNADIFVKETLVIQKGKDATYHNYGSATPAL